MNRGSKKCLQPLFSTLANWQPLWLFYSHCSGLKMSSVFKNKLLSGVTRSHYGRALSTLGLIGGLAWSGICRVMANDVEKDQILDQGCSISLHQAVNANSSFRRQRKTVCSDCLCRDHGVHSEISEGKDEVETIVKRASDKTS